MDKLFGRLKGDRVIWIVLFILTLVSLLIVYSATGSLAYRQRGGNTGYYLVKQLVFIGLGFALMLGIVQKLKTKWLAFISPLLVLGSLGLLAIAQVLNMGSEGTGRTINLGILSFQPAEFAKISLVLFVSGLLSKAQVNGEKPSRKVFLTIMLAVGAVCGIIMLSNFSTAALLFITIFGMMLMGRISKWYMGGVIVAGLLMVVAIYFIAPHTNIGRFKTIRGRIERFVGGDPESEVGMTQADYAKLAIYRGGQIGNGPAGSEVRNHMAAAYNDFIFAILIEEYGWIAFGVLVLYLILASRAGVIIRNSKRSFQAFMVAGLTMMIMLQALTNMAVSCGLFPVTGQPLPWVSLGGTSTLFTALSFGLILRASYQNTFEEEEVQPVTAHVEEEEMIEIPDDDVAFAEVGAID